MNGWLQPKNNYWTPSVAPTTDDNRADGFEPGSEWLYGEEMFKCVYSDLTTATWKQFEWV